MVEFSPEELALLSNKVVMGSDLAEAIPDIPDSPDIDLGGLPITERPFFDREGLYRPGRGTIGYRVIDRKPEPQHVLFAEFRERMTKKPSECFYIQAKDGTVGWVPWIGSIVAWPWERAWECDLLEGSPSDFRKKDTAK